MIVGESRDLPVPSRFVWATAVSISIYLFICYEVLDLHVHWGYVWLRSEYSPLYSVMMVCWEPQVPAQIQATTRANPNLKK